MQDKIRQCVEELRTSQGDTIALENAGEIVDQVPGTMLGDFSGMDTKIYREVQSLAECIEATKAEVVKLCPSGIKDEHRQIANTGVDAIIVGTEEATGAILDACERMEKAAALIGAFGESGQVSARLSTEKTKDMTGVSKERQLTGPQLPDHASSQEDIDKLLASCD